MALVRRNSDPVEAGLVGQLAQIDLEAFAVGFDVAPVSRVSDQGFVAFLQLGLEPVDDRLTVGLVLLGLGLGEADDLMVFSNLDLFDP